MFESSVLDPGADACGEDWFDPAWLEQVPEPEQIGQVPVSGRVPSGWLALELDQASVDPAGLSDAELIDTIVGFDRVSSWALARQAGLLAEFARRRPGDDGPPSRSDVPARHSGFAPDEVGLALRLTRTAATTRLVMARALDADLPATLAGWRAGVIDERKARAIAETSYLLPAELHGALEARVLPRAGSQTLSQLRAALARAVLVLDPQGAAARHEQRRADRRVVLSPDTDGMASLWALLSAPDATAAYQRLGELARDMGAADPRGMDARRADLLVDLLTGRRCAATGQGSTPGCDSDCQHPTQHLTDTTATHRGCRASRPGKPLVSVLVPITMLMGLDDQPGELAGYGPIPAHLAREIAAGGTWRRLLTDPASGALLDYGRTTYTPPAALADFVRARDQSCRHPGCGQRAATADLDHTIAWDHGGTTSADNLHAACRRHHRLKTHAPGWHVTQHPTGQITWTTPTGHTYPGHDPPESPASDALAPRSTAPHTGAGSEPEPPPF